MRSLATHWRAARLTILVVAIVFGVAAATDGPGSLGPAWKDHAIWSGVLTGLLILVLGAFGIEAFLRHHDTVRWEKVKDIGLKALGTSANDLRDGMDRLLGDERRDFRLGDAAFPPGFLEALSADFNADHGASLVGLDRHDRYKRLTVILEGSGQSLQRMEQGLDFVKRHHRDRLARWSGVFFASERLVGQMARVAELNQRLSRLQSVLSDYAWQLERDRAAASPLRLQVILRWDAITTQTVALQEDFMRLAGETGWEHPNARRHLSSRGRRFLQKRDAQRSMLDLPDETVEPLRRHIPLASAG